MLIFLDTEFTSIDVRNPRLISLGLIAEDGQTFYAELSDTWKKHHCSLFVKRYVLPLLEGGTCRVSAQEARKRLIDWIEEFTQEVRIVCYAPDYDGKLLMDFFDIYRPNNLDPSTLCFLPTSFSNNDPSLAAEIALAQEQALAGLPEHHALRDAKQLKATWDVIKKSNHPNFHKLVQ